jgi:hypothetical protein
MKVFTIPESVLTNIIVAAAEQGAARVVARLRPQEDAISQAEAWRIYGRQAVSNWRKYGLVKPRKNGVGANSKLVYSRAALDAAAHGIAFTPEMQYTTFKTAEL